MQYIFCIIAKKLWPFPRIIAHRGGGDCAPENTILGIETGKRYGIPAVEFDVMLSKDDVPMLKHPNNRFVNCYLSNKTPCYTIRRLVLLL